MRNDTINEQLRDLHRDIMRRCYNEKHLLYKTYGAKGITVCEEWHNRATFKEWCKSNGYQKGYHLLRKDGKIGYNSENCYFKDPKESVAKTEYKYFL